MPVYPLRGTSIADADAAVGDVHAPRTFYSIAPPRKLGTMPTVTLDPALNAYPAGYHAGAASLTAVDADLAAPNIITGKQIFGVDGTAPPPGDSIFMPGLAIPVPSIALSTQTNDGALVTYAKDLTVPAPSIAAPVTELSWLLIDDCEANIWDEYVGANVTSTIDAVVFQIGTHSAKLDVADLEAVGLLATIDYAPIDLTTYNFIKMWIRSTVAISSGDLTLLLDEHAQCVSPLKTLNIGALVANTWTEVSLALGDASGLGAIISIGINMAVDKGAFILNIDQVRATKGA